MAAEQDDEVMYAHHPDGYSRLSLFQQNIQKAVKPYVAAAARSLNDNRENTSFVVVDYGAADGVNSVPMIAACADELSKEVKDYEWIFNDIISFGCRADIKMVEDHLKVLLGWRKTSVKLRYVVGSFYKQVVADESVDLGISVSAVDWLSHRPPIGCGKDPFNPDEATRAISAKDWRDFLKCRAKELKRGGKLITLIVSIESQNVASVKGNITVAPQRVIRDMLNEGIINEEEYEFASTYVAPSRTEADIRAPFLDSESGLSKRLHLAQIKTFDIACPFYDQWKKAGGRENATATERFVSQHVNLIKSYYNSFWKILEETRSGEGRAAILDTFYRRVEDMVRGDLEGYHATHSVSVVEMIKY